MRKKKVAASLLSVALSLSLCTFNVTALNVTTEFESVSEITAEETVDISELLTEVSPEYSIPEMDIALFDGVQETDEVFETSNDETEPYLPENNGDEDEYGITPYSEPNPLSEFGIIAYKLGDANVLSSTSAKWSDPVEFTSPQTSLSLSIDTTGYKYICFSVYQWGYTTSSEEKLDRQGPISSWCTESYNALGKPVSAGDIVYGFLYDYIFEIPFECPADSRNSKAIFRAYYNQLGYNISKDIKANIIWSTPTEPAPTTPSISYNYPNVGDYAVVTGLSTDMEYCGEFKYENSDETYLTNWTSINGTSLLVPINDEEYNFLIRYKKAANGFPSLYCSITVKTRDAAPDSGCVTCSTVEEILAIYNSDRPMEIALGDGTGYFAITPGYYRIDSFIDSIPAGGFNRIYVRFAADAERPASKSTTARFYARNPNTPDSVYYENGILRGLTSDVMFRLNGGTWYSTQYSDINITSFMSSTSTTLLELRYMPTSTSSCSQTIQITLPALT